MQGHTITLVSRDIFENLMRGGRKQTLNRAKDARFAGSSGYIGMPEYTLAARRPVTFVGYTNRVQDCLTLTASNGRKGYQAHVNDAYDKRHLSRCLNNPPIAERANLRAKEQQIRQLIAAGNYQGIYKLLLGQDIDTLGKEGAVTGFVAGGKSRYPGSRELHDTLTGLLDERDIPCSSVFGANDDIGIFSHAGSRKIALQIDAGDRQSHGLAGSDVLDLDTLHRTVDEVKIAPGDRLITPDDPEYGNELQALQKAANSRWNRFRDYRCAE